MLLGEALEIVCALRSPSGVVYYVEMAAGLAAAEGDHAMSVRLFSAATSFRAAAGIDAPAPIASAHESALAAARTALGADAVEAAREAGAALELFDAGDEAFAWAGRQG